jgi:hypothetical protein
MLHAVCQCCQWHEAGCLPDKSAPTLERAVKRLLAKIQRQYGYTVVIARIDSERGYSSLLKVLRDLGIVVEPRAEYAEELNGMTERAGAIIISRARAIKIDAGLPKNLANECVMTAIYVLNRFLRPSFRKLICSWTKDWNLLKTISSPSSLFLSMKHVQ